MVETVLLVEDNPDDELLALRALKKAQADLHVVVARNGEEAIDYIFARGKFVDRDRSQLPKVIFLDIKLPKLDGLQVLERIRQNAASSIVPVVLLTSSDEERDMIRGYQLGANSYINKPVSYDEFISQVALLKDYWLKENKTPRLAGQAAL
jgi:DNA-binding response OmpR family regulator